MKDLLALAELFGLTVIRKSAKPLPTITVRISDTETVILQWNPNGTIWATDRIQGVPMRFFGNGSWRFAVEL